MFHAQRLHQLHSNRRWPNQIGSDTTSKAAEEHEEAEDSDSDDDGTILYNQSDSDSTEPSSEEEDAEEIAAENSRTRSGRMIRRKAPTDYDD